jgi:nucleoside-diphosphate kinase
MQRTLAIIKPDAVSKRLTGKILERIEQEGFIIKGLRRLRLNAEQAAAFYAVHRERPFFDSLTRFMTEGPVVVAALEADDAVTRWRAVMGATDPAQAEESSLRRLFGSTIERNAVHGSDAPETAAVELAFFFSGRDLI